MDFGASARFGAGRVAFFYPLGLFADPLYADALYSSGYPVASQPPIIFLQAPAATANSVPERLPSPQPLMIELQGNRYVRVSGEDASGVEMIDGATMIDGERVDRQPSSRPLEKSGTTTQAVAPRELPPVVLVFRDGRREEVSEYAIADGVLYASSDYYSVGSWNKKIALSSLNLPQTVSLNSSRGVRFQIPAAPNEVIVRP